MDVLSEHGYRADGRKAGEARRLTCRLGVYEQADGSAYLEQGLTKVLVAVYGPHEIRNKAKARKEAEGACIINCQFSMATFSTSERKVRPRGDRKTTEARQALEKVFNAAILTANYPNSQIDIFAEVLEADGGNLPVAINAASLALADAGIAMWGLVGAVSMGCADRKAVVDTSHAEESNRAMPRLTLAALPRTRAILLMELQHRLHFDLMGQMLEAGQTAVGEVVAVLDAAVRNHVADAANALGWTASTV